MIILRQPSMVGVAQVPGGLWFACPGAQPHRIHVLLTPRTQSLGLKQEEGNCLRGHRDEVSQFPKSNYHLPHLKSSFQEVIEIT
jgi:hypothetical protein